MKETGYIFDIKKYSINDGPGIRTTVFFKGCPLNCLWCHNPESRNLKPEKIEPSDRWSYYSYSCSRDSIGMEVTADKVFEEILKDAPFYDQSGGGVTFSGGEPLMQPDFLMKLLQMCRQSNIHTAVDTSGYAPFELFESIYDYTDLFLFDIKIADEQLHKKYTGVSNKLIIANLKKLTSFGKKIFIRIPVIPSINDSKENINKIIEMISALKNIESINLLPYHNSAKGKYRKLNKEYHLSGIESPSSREIEKILGAFTSAGLPATVGG